MEMAIELLGPIAVWADGRHHRLGSLKEQVLLALLAVECDRPVRTDTLISRIWDDRPPAHARDNLSSYASRLRRRLKDALGRPSCVASTPDAYRLALDPEQVDLHRFRRLREQADALVDSGDDEGAIQLRREAEGLWQGDALGGLPGTWISRLRTGLDEELRALTLDRIDAELRAGRAPRLLAELHQMATRHPLDEGIGAQLMTALYRCDRQADALRVYQDIRRRLVESLGAEPGTRLQEVHRRVLDQDLEFAVTPQYRRADRHGQPRTLPPGPADFEGRDDEVAALEEPKADATEIIVGMPGIGKTTLAVHMAHRLAPRYPDAQLFLNLAAHDTTRPPLTVGQALNGLLRMIGVPPRRMPATPGELSALWRAEMANRRAIIVLDDATDEQQVEALLPRAEGCRVLITARRNLSGLAGRHLRLGTLPVAAAVSLFARSAGCAATERVENVVRLCGRLPLAIRLTAARVRSGESIDDLLDELALDGLELDGSSAEMGAALEVSYSELPEVPRQVFRRLCLHPGDQITEEAAAALAGLPVSGVRPVLSTLLDHHLLEAAAGDLYRFHQLLRAFGREQARAEDTPLEIRRTVGRLLDYYLSTAHQADRILHPHRARPAAPTSRTVAIGSPAEAQRWLDHEWGGITATIEYCTTHEWLREGADLAYLVSKFLEDRGLWEEEIAALNLALRSVRDTGDQRGTVRTELELAFVSFLRGDDITALDHAQGALAMARQLGDDKSGADALDRIGLAHWLRGHYRETLAYCQEALGAYRDIDDPTGQAAALNHIGIAYWHMGRHHQSFMSLDAALQIYRETGDGLGAARVLNNLGDLQQSRGYHRDAIRFYQASREILDQIPDHHHHAILHSNVGTVQRYKGDHRQALASYRKALAIYRAADDRRNMADTFNNIGVTYCHLERHNEALIHHQRAHDIATAITHPYEQCRALLGMATAYRGLCRYAQSLERYDAALARAREIGDLYQEAKVHEGVGGVLAHTDDPEAARIRWRQALNIFRDLNVPEAWEVEILLDALGMAS
ncbi:tetratricopeptide repeat protein [Actinoallomurus sp. CA-150999]|uniref:AfsR/SARP family transcriptional regulator n=1 Tax=Actinoallomurus sp. CA-150999 TaxID=3239887 RepID=UPI003D94898F